MSHPKQESSLFTSELEYKQFATRDRLRRYKLANEVNRLVAVTVGILAILPLIAWLSNQDKFDALVFSICLMLLSLSAGTYPLFADRNRQALSINLTLSMALLTSTAAVIALPTLLPAVSIGLLTLLVLAAFLLDRRNAMALFIASIVVFFIIVIRLYDNLQVEHLFGANTDILRAINICFVMVAYVSSGIMIITLVGLQNNYSLQAERSEADRIDLALEREKVVLLERFIGNASHDLKTPLAAMKMSIAVIGQTPDQEKRAYHEQLIKDRIVQLNNTLDNMLYLTKLDKHETHDWTPIDYTALVNSLVCLQKTPMFSKQQTVTTSGLETSVFILGNAKQIHNALCEILTNASYYTPSGGSIHIDLKTTSHAAILSVQDNGIGIPDHSLPYVFDLFYKVDQARTLSPGGNGVGLTISQRIIEEHHGHIEVSSTLGEGTIFTISLPRHNVV